MLLKCFVFDHDRAVCMKEIPQSFQQKIAIKEKISKKKLLVPFRMH
jgi:hypothetical protein